MAQDSKQIQKIDAELERQQQEAFKALKIYMSNIQQYLRQCDNNSTDLAILGKLITQFENSADTVKSIITRHFAQRVVKNAYRKKRK